jgi:hypothetical protein
LQADLPSQLGEVRRNAQARIHHPQPATRTTFLNGKVKIFRLGIHHDIEVGVLLGRSVKIEHQARLRALLHTSGYPGAGIVCAPRRGGFYETRSFDEESDDVLILLVPVQPGGFVMLVVGIVVPALGIS